MRRGRCSERKIRGARKAVIVKKDPSLTVERLRPIAVKTLPVTDAKGNRFC